VFQDPLLPVKNESAARSHQGNNGAVDLYQAQGKTTTHPMINALLCKDIIPSLQLAVATMRSFHAEVNDVLGNRTSVIRESISASFCFEQNPQVSSSEAGFENSNGFVYNHPLPLSRARFEDFSPDDLESFGLMASATCMINLAMACHQLWSLSGHEGPGVKAGTLYDLILCMLNHIDCGHWEGKSFIAVACLVLNNRAQLFYAQGDYANCRRCRMEMYSLWPIAHCSLEEFLGENVVKQLKFNLIHLRPPTIALAA
jgi:hypothetical protein